MPDLQSALKKAQKKKGRIEKLLEALRRHRLPEATPSPGLAIDYRPSAPPMSGANHPDLKYWHRIHHLGKLHIVPPTQVQDFRSALDQWSASIHPDTDWVDNSCCKTLTSEVTRVTEAARLAYLEAKAARTPRATSKSRQRQPTSIWWLFVLFWAQVLRAIAGKLNEAGEALHAVATPARRSTRSRPYTPTPCTCPGEPTSHNDIQHN